MSDEVLTIREVAALLAEETVYAMANAGELPAFKIRGQWRIRRAELDQWIDEPPEAGKTSVERDVPGATKRERARNGNGSAVAVGFEQKLGQAPDKLRNNLDAAEYKHAVLGFISDTFEEKRAALEVERKSGTDPEDPDAYRAESIFRMPEEARWSHLQSKAKIFRGGSPCCAAPKGVTP